MKTADRPEASKRKGYHLGPRLEEKMAATFAKVFIIMTLVFELITIATGTALYPVFSAVAAIVTGCLVILYAVHKIHEISDKNKAATDIISAL